MAEASLALLERPEYDGLMMSAGSETDSGAPATDAAATAETEWRQPLTKGESSAAEAPGLFASMGREAITYTAVAAELGMVALTTGALGLGKKITDKATESTRKREERQDHIQQQRAKGHPYTNADAKYREKMGRSPRDT